MKIQEEITAQTASNITNVPWRLWIAILIMLPVADICLFKAHNPGIGFSLVISAFTLLGLYVSKQQGRLIGLALLIPSILVSSIYPSLTNLAAIFIGFTILLWKRRTNPLSWNLIDIPKLLASSPFVALRLFFQSISHISTHTQHVRKAQKYICIALPTVFVSAIFLILLCAGNAILARWASDATALISRILEPIIFPDMTRILFWAFIALISVIIFVPAWLCQNGETGQKSLPSPFDISKNKSLLKLQFIFVLIGVNVVYLFTNTLDAIYLWIRQSPPNGISTTEYLYEGFYILIVTTLLAGLFLAFVFNHSDSVKNTKAITLLANTWIVQNLFLIAGVGFRLWLHVDKYCLTPRRMQVGLFLVLVTIGFILLSIYIIRKRSLNWLLSSNFIAASLFIFSLQFLNIGEYCVDSAIRKIKENPDLNFDAHFFNSVGISGWRLLEVMANDEEHQRIEARFHWKELQRNLTEKPTPFHWQNMAYYPYHESKELCEKLNIPTCDMRRAWDQTVMKMRVRY